MIAKEMEKILAFDCKYAGGVSKVGLQVYQLTKHNY
jgi:hypothetical protein